MAYKCAKTGEYCKADCGGFYGHGDSCPVHQYKPTCYREGKALRLNDTCRFLGLKRQAELVDKEWT